VNKTNNHREFDLLVSNETGESIEESGVTIQSATSITGDQNMRYWSKEAYGAGYFTVVFLTGAVVCQLNTSIKNSATLVYK
jgi:hypothetical protein